MAYKYRILTVILFLATALRITAQNKAVAKGDFAVKSHHYKKALAIFKKALVTDSTDVSLKEKLAAVYMAMDDYEKAEALYAKLIADSKGDKLDKFYYAQALRNNGKYDLAEKAYNSFGDALPDDVRAKEFRNFAKVLPILFLDSAAYEITDIPENSDASDIGPAFCLYSLCFSSNRAIGGTVKYRDILSGEGSYNLYMLPGVTPEKARIPEKMKGPINNRLNQGPATFSQDGTEMIFTQSNQHKKATDGIAKLGLYHANFDSVKHKWGNIKPLDIVNYNYNMAHPALSKDGKQLFFVSDMPGGFGETDIYVSNKIGNEWSAPVNLGIEINTPGKELFPYIADNGTLFFSSDSRIGLGGLDIYSATLSNGKWGGVKNLGAPFNSRYDDFGYITIDNQLSGYFVSNRPGGKGSDDIYKFVRKK